MEFLASNPSGAAASYGASAGWDRDGDVRVGTGLRNRARGRVDDDAATGHRNVPVRLGIERETRAQQADGAGSTGDLGRGVGGDQRVFPSHGRGRGGLKAERLVAGHARNSVENDFVGIRTRRRVEIVSSLGPERAGQVLESDEMHPSPESGL